MTQNIGGIEYTIGVDYRPVIRAVDAIENRFMNAANNIETRWDRVAARIARNIQSLNLELTLLNQKIISTLGNTGGGSGGGLGRGGITISHMTVTTLTGLHTNSIGRISITGSGTQIHNTGQVTITTSGPVPPPPVPPPPTPPTPNPGGGGGGAGGGGTGFSAALSTGFAVQQALSGQVLAGVGGVVGTLLGSIGGQAGITMGSAIGSAIGGAAQAAIAAIYTPLIGQIQQSVVQFSELDFTLRQIQISTGATVPEMDSIKKRIIDLGIESTKTTSQVANVTLALTRAGFAANGLGKDFLNLVTGVVRGSEATGEDPVKFGLATGAAYQIFGGDPGKIADELTVAANRVQVSVDKITLALSNSGSTAKTWGQNLESTLATLLTIMQTGASPYVAGTATKNIIDSIAVPRGGAAGLIYQAQSIIDRTNAADSGPNSRFRGTGLLQGSSIAPLEQALPNLRAALEIKFTKGGVINQELVNAAFRAIFGAQAAPQALYLSSAQGAKRLVENQTREANAEGTALYDQSQLTGQGIKGATTFLAGSIETFITQVGEKLSPAVESLSRNFGNVINNLIGSDSLFKTIGDSVQRFNDIIGAHPEVWDNMTQALSNIATLVVDDLAHKAIELANYLSDENNLKRLESSFESVLTTSQAIANLFISAAENIAKITGHGDDYIGAQSQSILTGRGVNNQDAQEVSAALQRVLGTRVGDRQRDITDDDVDLTISDFRNALRNEGGYLKNPDTDLLRRVLPGIARTPEGGYANNIRIALGLNADVPLNSESIVRYLSSIADLNQMPHRGDNGINPFGKYLGQSNSTGMFNSTWDTYATNGRGWEAIANDPNFQKYYALRRETNPQVNEVPLPVAPDAYSAKAMVRSAYGDADTYTWNDSNTILRSFGLTLSPVRPWTEKEEPSITAARGYEEMLKVRRNSAPGGSGNDMAITLANGKVYPNFGNVASASDVAGQAILGSKGATFSIPTPLGNAGQYVQLPIPGKTVASVNKDGSISIKDLEGNHLFDLQSTDPQTPLVLPKRGGATNAVSGKMGYVNQLLTSAKTIGFKILNVDPKQDPSFLQSMTGSLKGSPLAFAASEDMNISPAALSSTMSTITGEGIKLGGEAGKARQELLDATKKNQEELQRLMFEGSNPFGLSTPASVSNIRRYTQEYEGQIGAGKSQQDSLYKNIADSIAKVQGVITESGDKNPVSLKFNGKSYSLSELLALVQEKGTRGMPGSEDYNAANEGLTRLKDFVGDQSPSSQLQNTAKRLGISPKLFDGMVKSLYDALLVAEDTAKLMSAEYKTYQKKVQQELLKNPFNKGDTKSLAYQIGQIGKPADQAKLESSIVELYKNRQELSNWATSNIELLAIQVANKTITPKAAADAKGKYESLLTKLNTSVASQFDLLIQEYVRSVEKAIADTRRQLVDANKSYHDAVAEGYKIEGYQTEEQKLEVGKTNFEDAKDSIALTLAEKLQTIEAEREKIHAKLASAQGAEKDILLEQLSTYDKIQKRVEDTSVQLYQNALDQMDRLRNAALDVIDQIHTSFIKNTSNLFSDLVTKTNSSFGDIMKDFKKSIGDTIAKIGADLLYQNTLKPVIDSLFKNIGGFFGAEDKPATLDDLKLEAKTHTDLLKEISANTDAFKQVSDTPGLNDRYTFNGQNFTLYAPNLVAFRGLDSDVAATGQTGGIPGTTVPDAVIPGSAKDNINTGLKRIRAGESPGNRGTDVVNKDSKDATGHFQFLHSTAADMKKKRFKYDPYSSDPSEQANAALEYIYKFKPKAYKAMLAGDWATFDKQLNGIWTSLPGGAEESKYWKNPNRKPLDKQVLNAASPTDYGPGLSAQDSVASSSSTSTTRSPVSTKQSHKSGKGASQTITSTVGGTSVKVVVSSSSGGGGFETNWGGGDGFGGGEGGLGSTVPITDFPDLLSEGLGGKRTSLGDNYMPDLLSEGLGGLGDNYMPDLLSEGLGQTRTPLNEEGGFLEKLLRGFFPDKQTGRGGGFLPGLLGLASGNFLTGGLSLLPEIGKLFGFDLFGALGFDSGGSKALGGLFQALPFLFADGGQVPMTAGTPGRDSVPSLLTPGEGIITVSGMSRIGGPATLEAINSGKVKLFSAGGVVSAMASGGSSAPASAPEMAPIKLEHEVREIGGAKYVTQEQHLMGLERVTQLAQERMFSTLRLSPQARRSIGLA